MADKKAHVHLSDIAGISLLAVSATREVTNLAQAVHNSITHSPALSGNPVHGHVQAISNLVYTSVRGVTEIVGGATNFLAPFAPILNEPSSPEREAALAALNGVVGDYLVATGNPLAISMQLRRKGRPLAVEKAALTDALADQCAPAACDKLLVLVHGLCMNDLHWSQDLQTALARELGYTTIHLRYNSGLHVSRNGMAFAALLQNLLEQWPGEIKKFAILAHSMGGLVARSAHYYGVKAGHDWPKRLQKMIFLGTPHHGAPLERLGNVFEVCLGMNRYSASFARLGKIRSAGITDMRYGNVLDEDWQGVDRFQYVSDTRHPLPLPENVSCYAIAGYIGSKAGALLGDGMVSVDSALGRHRNPLMELSFPRSSQWVARGADHWDLLSSAAVHEKILSWL
ncbi:MAG TPA: alpha/beta fold hydrolase [Terriglobales bacterium]